VIHFPEYNHRPFVCIWPEIIRVSDADGNCDYLCYYLNREHYCKVELIRKSESEIVFEDKDGHFCALGKAGDDPITLSVITEEEFKIVKQYYEQQGWQKLQTKEDLVKNHIDCIDLNSNL